MNDQIIEANQMMAKYLNIDFQKADRITTTWKKVVSRIHSNKYESEDSERRMPIGERLAGNTKVVDLKNGVLLIEADHSGWIQYLRFYEKFILKGLKMEAPDLKISCLAFRLAGSNAKLSEFYDDQLKKYKEQMQEKLDEQDKELNKFYEENKTQIKKTNQSTLPPELLAKFESIKNDMLTNSENK